MLEFLISDNSKLHLNSVDFHEKQILLNINVVQPYSYCPSCHNPSIRVHSNYFRKVADLPSDGFRVTIQLDVRRFFCDQGSCPKRTFTERIPTVVGPYARKTVRLIQAQSRIGFVIGGEAGSRISEDLALSTSPDTLLRIIRTFTEPQSGQVNCLGVDDWAFHIGISYGTILVDLESHRPIDLLTDRSSESLATWLKLHPEIKLVSRDRFSAYKEGINLGAPQATQVADRWHLLHNLTDSVERILSKRYKELQATQSEMAQPAPEVPVETFKEELPSIPKDYKPSFYEQQRQINLEKHGVQFQEVKQLYAEGYSIRAIQKKLHFSRERIRKFLHNEELPIYRRRKKQTMLDPYADYIKQRWESGCRKGMPIWKEIQEKGYRGTYQSFARFILPLRQSMPSKPMPGKKSKVIRQSPTDKPLTPRQITWLFVRLTAKLDDKQLAYLNKLLISSQEFEKTYDLVQEFWSIVREKKKAALGNWLVQAKQSGISELHYFAFGIEKDLAAVEAALTYTWSNGPVEGHNNRLKMIKRQMYGRARFDLLRLRVLYS